MDTKTEKTAAQKYLLANKFEANESGEFIYTSPFGFPVELSSTLEDFLHEEIAGTEDTISDLHRQVDNLKDEIRELESDAEDTHKENGSLQEEVDDLYNIADGLMPETLIDNKKLEVLRRLYKHLTLEELEAIEAPFKERVGYIDLIY